MTSKNHEQSERLTRTAMIDEFERARRRRLNARDQTFVRTVGGARQPLSLAGCRGREEAADRWDLIRWDSDKG